MVGFNLPKMAPFFLTAEKNGSFVHHLLSAQMFLNVNFQSNIRTFKKSYFLLWRKFELLRLVDGREN
jgi:hypothetical protein